MNVNQEALNKAYQAALDGVYSGEVVAKGKYINGKAVLLHQCTSCKTDFWGRPLWLVKNNSHKCFEVMAGSSVEPKKKKAPKKPPKKATGIKQSNCKPGKVTEEMKVEMIRLYTIGGSLKGIAKHFGVTPPTVKRHIEKAGVR